ncbi:MAG: deoC [Gammaproteobacteria bacterium]|jgi:deoxyribose-phosphate aldolase|nr:deoC [Gammaproteobacteria bacterium]
MNNFEYLIHRVEDAVAERAPAPLSMLPYLDLTSLNTDDDEKTIGVLCEKAVRYGVAAVCVYPAFVPQAVQMLKGSAVNVATVINFPQGNQALPYVLETIEDALKDGATELDIVIPYQEFLATRDAKHILSFVKVCKNEMVGHCLKIILESGAFYDTQLLEKAALAALEGGANFLKTSTGKIPQGASLMTAAILVNAIQRFGDAERGFKVSGGVRHYNQAKAYVLLAELMMGQSWVSPETFRIGASSLLDELVAE